MDALGNLFCLFQPIEIEDAHLKKHYKILGIVWKRFLKPERFLKDVTELSVFTKTFISQLLGRKEHVIKKTFELL